MASTQHSTAWQPAERRRFGPPRLRPLRKCAQHPAVLRSVHLPVVVTESCARRDQRGGTGLSATWQDAHGAARRHEMDGGERGIRTLGAACDSTHDFQSCTFSQLGHLSAYRDGTVGRWPAPHRRREIRRTAAAGNGPHPARAGGEGGIRTHDPGFSQDTAFRERGLQPLGNLSVSLS